MQSEETSRSAFKIGEWLVQPSLNEISNSSRSLRVEPKVMEVLLCLTNHANEVVSKEMLIHTVWADRFVSDDVITTTIWQLRQALGDEAKNPRSIQTIPRRGYRLIASVVVHEASPVKAEPTLNLPHKHVSPAREHRFLKAGICTLCALLFPLLLWQALRWRNQAQFQHNRAPISSVAVLPFRNLSGDPSKEYLAEAMTESLITDLARSTQLRVVPRASVMRYRTLNKAAPDIARDLGVDAVIEGSVVASGERARISVQLIHAATDQHLWTESYERELRDVVVWQSEMSRLIALGIGTGLTLPAQAGPVDAAQTPAAARGAYLQGRELWKRRTEEGTTLALAQFERAVQLAPEYAPAWAGLADAHMQLVMLDTVRPEEGFPKAKAAVLRALQLNDALSEAHASLAMIKLSFDWDWLGAETEFQRALALDPTYATASNWYSQYLWAAGRADEALREAAKAQELDPQSIATLLNAGNLFLLRRQSDQAITCFRRILELDPKYVVAWKALSRAYDQQSKPREAEAAYLRFRELTNAPSVARMKEDFTAWSRKRDPRYLVQKLSFAWKRKYVRATYIARLYADLGDRERALEWLEKAYTERDSNLLFLKTDGSWDSLRADPRFASLTHRVGLAS